MSKKDKKDKKQKDDKHKHKHQHKSHKDKHTHPHKDKHKHKEHTHKKEKGHGAALHVPEKLSPEDYFRKSEDFRVWLKTSRDLEFEKLDSEQAREEFDRFVEKWNEGQLEPMYYEGTIPEELLTTAKQTSFQWGFKSALTEDDEMKLASARDSVYLDTRTDKQLRGKDAELGSAKRPRSEPNADDDHKETQGHSKHHRHDHDR